MKLWTIKTNECVRTFDEQHTDRVRACRVAEWWGERRVTRRGVAGHNIHVPACLRTCVFLRLDLDIRADGR
jgi:hypothetical protein